MARVVMLLHNAFTQDPRVSREAKALVRAGHEVTVIATWEPAVTPKTETRDGYRIRRVSRRAFGVDLITSRFERVIGPEAWSTSHKPAPASPGTPRERGPTIVRVPVMAARRALRGLPTAKAAIRWRMALAAWRARPDVVHAHDLNTLAAGVRAARLARAKLVYDSHEISPGLPTVRDPGRVIRAERRVIGRADAVIHTTPMRAAWAAETYGIEMPAVIRNVPERVGEVTPVDLAAEAGFAPGTSVIMHQGYMQPNRGLETLVEAMSSLDGYGLMMLGGGRQRPLLEKMVADRGVGDRVVFRDPVPHEELLGWTAGSWCGVSLLVDTCLNHTYSLPNKLFEYIAVGVPVIASDNPEIAAFVTEHRCGELCDPTDASSIVEAVHRLAARREEASRAARAAGERYRWENEEEKLLDLYARLLTEPGAGVSSRAASPREGS
jgi:glycosyltransferase involved in cell wall biosynthesis